MKPYRVGVVGLGWVAGAHIETFKKIPGVEVAGVSTRRHWTGESLQQKFGVPMRAYASYEEMLADPSIDVIDICTPHPLHAAQAIAAAQAGKHLIIEKPVATSWRDVSAVRDAVHAAKVKTCVCFELRYSRQAIAIRAAIDKDLLGELHYGEVDYFHAIGPWYGQYEWNIKKEFGSSALLTAGCHAMDLLLYYMPGGVAEVTSYQARSSSKYFKAYEYATTSVSLLKYADGRVGKVAAVIDCLQPYYFHMHLIGSNGTVLDDKFTSLNWEGMGRDRWGSLGVPVVDSGDVSDHPYLPQFWAFFDGLRQDKPMPKTDIDAAVETHRVCFAADRSAELGRPVKLAELDA